MICTLRWRSGAGHGRRLDQYEASPSRHAAVRRLGCVNLTLTLTPSPSTSSLPPQLPQEVKRQINVLLLLHRVAHTSPRSRMSLLSLGLARAKQASSQQIKRRRRRSARHNLSPVLNFAGSLQYLIPFPRDPTYLRQSLRGPRFPQIGRGIKSQT